MLLAQSFNGFTLTEIQNMTPRERTNWLEIAREYGKVVRR